MGTPRQFAQYGKAGLWMSDAIPKLQEVADELCVIKSLHTDQFNHTPAELLLFTGSPRQGHPSMGSWVTYGLGRSEERRVGKEWRSRRSAYPQQIKKGKAVRD